MTYEPDPESGRLRAALARSLEAHDPSPAPVAGIIAAGRARRGRRRGAVFAATVSVAAAGLLVTLPVLHQAADPPRPQATIGAASPSGGSVSALVAQGSVGGTAWSVTLEFYPTLPQDFAGASARSLLCQRMVIGGVRVDHQGGPWSDCHLGDGPDDVRQNGEAGLWGLHEKGTSGFRLFVAHSEPTVAYGVVTLTDGDRLQAPAAAVPGTVIHAWAVAIAAGRTIASVDQYDVRHRLVSHETQWR
ncbi:hypothetical protein [Actinacidiphila paucisporea]|uniref:Uncharacterized protein n=1 Tax=Actinacidiphila paucisporea TaxID=310782 RepID=A0A1M7NXY5_9ACTN|nr:hypothetical protein [Actinacidiphila paucisporea]SHN09105.1 hypothetical protein SAMN05216499_12056 [Actinacidiphila paucisporea]